MFWKILYMFTQNVFHEKNIFDIALKSEESFAFSKRWELFSLNAYLFIKGIVFNLWQWVTNAFVEYQMDFLSFVNGMVINGKSGNEQFTKK